MNPRLITDVLLKEQPDPEFPTENENEAHVDVAKQACAQVATSFRELINRDASLALPLTFPNVPQISLSKVVGFVTGLVQVAIVVAVVALLDEVIADDILMGVVLLEAVLGWFVLIVGFSAAVRVRLLVRDAVKVRVGIVGGVVSGRVGVEKVAIELVLVEVVLLKAVLD